MNNNTDGSRIPRLNVHYKYKGKQSNRDDDGGGGNDVGVLGRNASSNVAATPNKRNFIEMFSERRRSTIGVHVNNENNGTADSSTGSAKNSNNTNRESDYRPLRRRRLSMLLGIPSSGKDGNSLDNRATNVLSSGNNTSSSNRYRRTTVSYNDPAFLQEVSDRDKKVLNDLNQSKKKIVQVDKEIAMLNGEGIPNLKYEINKKITLMSKLTKDLTRLDDEVVATTTRITELQEINDSKLKNLQNEQVIVLQNIENENFEDFRSEEELLKHDFKTFRDLKNKEIQSMKFQDNGKVQELTVTKKALQSQLAEKLAREKRILEEKENHYKAQINEIQETHAAEINKLEDFQKAQCLERLDTVNQKIEETQRRIGEIKRPKIDELEKKIKQLEANLEILNSNKDLNLKLQRYKMEEYQPRLRRIEKLQETLKLYQKKETEASSVLSKEKAHIDLLQNCIAELTTKTT